MLNVARQQRLDDLRARIATIEKRPLLAEGAALFGGMQDGEADWQALLKAPAGLLQEIYAGEPRNGGAAFGFALGLARQLITPSRPAILFLQLIHEAQETGLPYALGLKTFGIDPAQLIMGRLASPAELLWAVEEAIACQAVAAVIAEIAGESRAVDFTVSRRLSLRAATGGTSVFMLRYGREREASAARLRWSVGPSVSGTVMFDARMPGLPRWQISLEKGWLKATQTSEIMMLDWTENGFQRADSAARKGLFKTSISRSQPAALGYRLSQAG